MNNITKDGNTLLPTGYNQWRKGIENLIDTAKLKTAISVNMGTLSLYWNIGKSILQKQEQEGWGKQVIEQLSKDLISRYTDDRGYSILNLRYIKLFASEYPDFPILQVSLAELKKLPILQATLAELENEGKEYVQIPLAQISWYHHISLLSKVKDEAQRAYYITETAQNGWSRDVLLNYLSTDLYKREGKALSNFNSTLPLETSDLAQELTRDPYSFAFTGLTGTFNEKVLKEALLNNITQFLLELGTGFAYIGKEYKLQIDVKEKYIDLLFYNLNLSCYVVVEVKIGEFDFQDIGQLQGYVVAVNHLLRKEERDNPTIGIIICKSKNNTLAQYALEGSNLPIAISEYDLQRLYPTEVEGTIPTIAQIEDAINKSLNKDKP